MYLAAIFFLAIGMLAIIGIALILMLIAGIVLLVVGIVKKRQYKKNGMVKKYPKVCIVLGIILTIIPVSIVGYVGISSILKPSDNGYNPDTYDPQTSSSFSDYEYCEEKVIKEVIRCMDYDDVIGLKGLFAECAIADETKMDEKINNAMDIYEGVSVSYERVSYDGGSTKTRDGKSYNKGYTCTVHNLETSTGEVYNIEIRIKLVDYDEPEKEGIASIQIKDSQGETLIEVIDVVVH